MFVTMESAAGSTKCGAQPLQSSHRDQEAVTGRKARTQRGGGEQPEPHHRDAAPAEQIGGTAAQQQEAAEGQPVGGDHPLQVRFREVQLPPDRRERHVDDREIDDRHEVGHGQHCEGAPAVNLCLRCRVHRR